MSIEQGDYLKELRTKNNLSQEKLAEKLDISRQSISKWEQGTATPDSDNILKLSKLYGISTDEILNCGKISTSAQDENFQENRTPSEPPLYEYSDVIYVPNPLSVKEETTDEKGAEEERHHHDDNRNEDHRHDEHQHNEHQHEEHHHDEHQHKSKKRHSWFYVAYPFIAILATVLLGVFGNNMWPYSWLCLLTIPLYYTLVGAIRNKNPLIFCYPVLLILIYLILSFIFQIWHPLWVIFLTIPIYYAIFATIRKNKKNK